MEKTTETELELTLTNQELKTKQWKIAKTKFQK